MFLKPRLVIYLLLLNSYFGLDSSIVINGDLTSTTQTTTFNITTHAFDLWGGILRQPTMYIGAGVTADGSKQYAISRVNNIYNRLQPLTPANINLNGTANQANPLYGAYINFLKLNNDKPVALINGSFDIYQYTDVLEKLALISGGPVNDSNGLQAGALLALEASNSDQGQSFVACTPNSATDFGAIGSGIALFKIVNKQYLLQNNQCANALNNSSTVIGINDLVNLANRIDLHWSGELNCLFVALEAQAGSGSGAGARSIVVGKINPVPGQNYDAITFEAFVPDVAITGNNQIIGTGVANNSVTALKIKTMYTSTRLNYLIINGGNDSASAVGNQIYALPLVSGNNSSRGHLAKYNQTPTNVYTNNFFVGRTLDTPATTSGDLLTNSNPAAQVGNGALPLNANEQITDLFVAGDSVYAAIGTSSAPEASGIYYSQAIFDTNGLIANWTPWQAASGFDGPVFGAAINAIDNSYYYLTGSDSSHVNTIHKTVWSDGAQDGLLGGTSSDAQVGLVANLSNLFTDSNGGLFNLINFASSNPALNNLNLLIAAGYQQVALINCAASNNGDFSTGLTSANDGSYPATSTNSTIAAITGGALNEVSAITQANLVTNGSGMSWLVVGGSQGVAILRQNNGDGWSTPLTNLGDLNTSYQFELFGDFSFVKQIAYDDTYLYLLTQSGLFKTPLNSANLASSTPSITLITQPGDLTGTNSNDVFNDLIIDGNLALLATSAGLFRVANGSSILASPVEWTTVSVPEQLCVPATKLVTVSPSNGLGAGSNLYLVSSYRGLHQTLVNRFYVQNSGAINDDTILPLPDLYVANSLSYFLNFESFRDIFFTNGTLLINCLSRDANESSLVNILRPSISSGTTTAQTNPTYSVSLPAISGANLISSVIQNSFAGALIVSGEFGIRVNE